MKVLTPGHKYALENFEPSTPSNNTVEGGQVIQFIEKEPHPEAGKGLPTGALHTVNNGTTNEEVIKVMIDRCESLYAKFPSEETACAISHLKSALYAFQSRTYERQQRGVEGKALK